MLFIVIILNLIQIILAIGILIVSAGMLLYTIGSIFADAPFCPVRDRVLDTISEALKLQPGSVFYDLGCGNGKVLLEVAKNRNDITAIGIEKNLIPYILAKWNTRKNKNIKISFGDFKNYNFKAATHIYLYLYPKITTLLFSKFKKECKTGTRIITIDFQPLHIPHDEVIDLPYSSDGLCKKLYAYTLK